MARKSYDPRGNLAVADSAAVAGRELTEDVSEISEPPKRRRSRRSGKLQKSGGAQLDSLEKAIVSQLNQDGRKPFQAIARELGVDEKTVRNRFNKLREHGLLRIIPTSDGNKLKDCIVALIAITFSPEGRENPEQVVEAISSLPQVSWAGTILGRFDIIAEVIVDSREALAQLQLAELPAIAGVGLTEGFLVMSHHGTRGVPFIDSLLLDE